MYFWQAIAYLTMIVDHSSLLLPDSMGLYAHAIGRVAFPLFLYGITQGYKHSHDRIKYFLSLLALAVITEPVYHFYFDRHLNEIFYFLYALALLHIHDRSPGSGLTLALVAFFLPGYFFYAGLMALAMYRLNSIAQCAAVLVVLMLASVNINILHCIGILYFPIVRLFEQPYIRIPKILKYSFYPGHLFLLLVFQRI